MRFEVDENPPIEVATALRQARHDAATVVEQHLGGSDDAQSAALCQLEGRILVTLDMDDSEIRDYPPAEFPSLVVLRLRQQDKPYVPDVFMRRMQVLDQEPLEGHLWIGKERRIRVRGEPS